MKLFYKAASLFCVLVFITFMARRGNIDFNAVKFVSNAVREVITSEEGQATANELKDIAGETAVNIAKETKEITSEALEKKMSETNSEEHNSSLIPVTLLRVVDGDTLIVDSENEKNIRVRLIGIDTPESVHPDSDKNTKAGVIASDYTKELLKNTTTLYLQYDTSSTDQYGRSLAYVWLKPVADLNSVQNVSNYMLNGILLSDGYAIDKVYQPNVYYTDIFAEIREDAEQNLRGLWAENVFS